MDVNIKDLTRVLKVQKTAIQRLLNADKLKEAAALIHSGVEELTPSIYVDALQKALQNERTKDGNFFPTPIKKGSLLYSSFLNYAKTLGDYYETAAENYVLRVDERFPLSVDDFFKLAVSYGRSSPACPSGNRWSLTNLASDRALEYISSGLSTWFYSEADVNKALTAKVISLFTQKLQVKKDLYASTRDRSRVVQFLDTLAEHFSADRTNADGKLLKIAQMGISIAFNKFTEVNGKNSLGDKERDHTKMGYLVGRETDEGNTALMRMIQAIEAWQQKKNPVKIVVKSSDLSL